MANNKREYRTNSKKTEGVATATKVGPNNHKNGRNAFSAKSPCTNDGLPNKGRHHSSDAGDGNVCQQKGEVPEVSEQNIQNISLGCASTTKVPSANSSGKHSTTDTTNHDHGPKSVDRPVVQSKAVTHERKLIPVTGCFASVAVPATIVSLTPADLRIVLNVDAKALNADMTNAEKSQYVEGNLTSYQIAINSWLLILTDTQWCTSTAFVSFWTSEFSKRLLRKGLFKVIAEATSVADCLISDVPIASLPHGDGVELWSWYIDETRNLYESMSRPTATYISDMLQNLRYLKRFSPSQTKALSNECIIKFIETENKIFYMERQWSREVNSTVPYRYPKVGNLRLYDEVVSQNRGYTAGIEMCIREAREIAWSILYDYDSSRAHDQQYCYFSSGNINDGDKTQAGKFIAAGAKGPVNFGHFCVDLPAWDCKKFEEITYRSKIATVPKSYKAVRTVATEEAWRNFRMQGIRAELERCVTKKTNLRFNDQTPNQESARIGSANGELATLDLSSASDSISKKLVEKVFPPNVFADISEFISRYAVLPLGSVKPLRKFSTSGTPLCFPVEEILFYSIVRSATERIGRWSSRSDDDIREAVNSIIVFGDDMICAHWAAEHVIETLTLLGFTLNKEKSHWLQNDPYRESCGAEYWEGVSISSRYFPRKNILLPGNLSSFDRRKNEHVVALAILLDLQHKLAECKLRMANSYLASCIRKLIPDMTESYTGSTHSDIWMDYPEITKEFFDYDKFLGTEIDSNYLTHGSGSRALDTHSDNESHYIFVTEYDIPDRFKETIRQRQESGELLAYLSWLRDARHKSSVTDAFGIEYKEEQHNLKSYIGEPRLTCVKKRY